MKFTPFHSRAPALQVTSDVFSVDNDVQTTNAFVTAIARPCDAEQAFSSAVGDEVRTRQHRSKTLEIPGEFVQNQFERMKNSRPVSCDDAFPPFATVGRLPKTFGADAAE